MHGGENTMRASFAMTTAVIAVLFATPLNAGSDHWMHQNDTNKNGVVSKREFLRFSAQTFKRLDANHDGKLERNELRPLFGGR
jgi:hypothetical protein